MNVSETSVARVIDAHTPTGSGGDITCWCEERFESWAEHSMHVAAAVLASLNLTGEWRVLFPLSGDYLASDPTPFPPRHPCDDGEVIEQRFITPWQPIGEETK